MSVRVTPEALAVITRSLELAGVDPDEMGVRLRLAGGAVRPRFVREGEPDDIAIVEEGIRIFLAPSILEGGEEAEIAVTPEHEQLVVRPVRSN